MTDLNEYLQNLVYNFVEAIQEVEDPNDRVTAMNTMYSCWQGILSLGEDGTPLEGALTIVGLACQSLEDFTHVEARVDFRAITMEVKSRSAREMREDLFRLMAEFCPRMEDRGNVLTKDPKDHVTLGMLARIPAAAAGYALSLANETPRSGVEGAMASRIRNLF